MAPKISAFRIPSSGRDPGATVSGFPARDHAEELKFEAALRRVPELLEKLRRLERRVKELEGQAAADDEPTGE